MNARNGVSWLARVDLLVSATALLVACGVGVKSSDAVEQAQTQLDEQVMYVHEQALGQRAGDPTGVDVAAADRLGYAITGGNATSVVSASVTPDGVEVITTAGVRAQVGGGLSYQQATLGACLLTRATPGSPGGDVGERGTVSTEAVPCPDGVVPVADSAPVELTTTELNGLRSPVLRPDPAPCLTGSGDCVGG